MSTDWIADYDPLFDLFDEEMRTGPEAAAMNGAFDAGQLDYYHALGDYDLNQYYYPNHFKSQQTDELSVLLGFDWTPAACLSNEFNSPNETSSAYSSSVPSPATSSTCGSSSASVAVNGPTTSNLIGKSISSMTTSGTTSTTTAIPSQTIPKLLETTPTVVNGTFNEATYLMENRINNAIIRGDASIVGNIISGNINTNNIILNNSICTNNNNVITGYCTTQNAIPTPTTTPITALTSSQTQSTLQKTVHRGYHDDHNTYTSSCTSNLLTTGSNCNSNTVINKSNNNHQTNNVVLVTNNNQSLRNNDLNIRLDCHSDQKSKVGQNSITNSINASTIIKNSNISASSSPQQTTNATGSNSSSSSNSALKRRKKKSLLTKGGGTSLLAQPSPKLINISTNFPNAITHQMSPRPNTATIGASRLVGLSASTLCNSKLTASIHNQTIKINKAKTYLSSTSPSVITLSSSSLTGPTTLTASLPKTKTYSAKTKKMLAVAQMTRLCIRTEHSYAKPMAQ